jgi:hypothetical protein
MQCQSFLAYFPKILDVFLNVQSSNFFILSIAEKSLEMLKAIRKIIVFFYFPPLIERNIKKYKGKLPQIFLQLVDGTLVHFLHVLVSSHSTACTFLPLFEVGMCLLMQQLCGPPLRLSGPNYSSSSR